MNRPGTIKYLHSIGLKQKHIQIITNANQAYISKVINEKIRAKTKIDPILTNQEALNLLVLEKLLKLKPLSEQESLTEQDKCYIRLLRLLMVDKKDIEKLYSKVSKTTLANIGRDKNIDLHKFNSISLDIPFEDYLSFITTLLG
jgi:hypothetical protein